jgi:hypothetical protein
LQTVDFSANGWGDFLGNETWRLEEIGFKWVGSQAHITMVKFLKCWLWAAVQE